MEEKFVSETYEMVIEKSTGEKFLIKEKKGFLVTLENMETGEEKRTTYKKIIGDDFELLGTTIEK